MIERNDHSVQVSALLPVTLWFWESSLAFLSVSLLAGHDVENQPHILFV